MKLDAGRAFLACEYCATLHFPDPNADGIRVLDTPAGSHCPRCRFELVHASVGGERIFYCQQCRGLLIAMDVFLVVIEDLRSRHESSEYAGKQPDWNNLNRQALCPLCGAPMNTHPYAGPGAVILDSCSVCCVNWLDYGELQRIVRAPDRKFVMAIDEDETRESQLEQ